MRVDGPTPPMLPPSPGVAGHISGVSSFADMHLQASGAELPVLPPAAVECGEQAGRTRQQAERFRRRGATHRDERDWNEEACEQELEEAEPEATAGSRSYEDEAKDSASAGDDDCSGGALDVTL